MGISASQARLLQLLARKSDLEAKAAAMSKRQTESNTNEQPSQQQLAFLNEFNSETTETTFKFLMIYRALMPRLQLI